MTKQLLTALPVKNYIFNDGVTTLPHGHRLLRPIYEANMQTGYDQLFSEEHLTKLKIIENKIIESFPILARKIQNNQQMLKIKQEVYDACHFS